MSGSAEASSPETGFSLIETLVLVAILLVIGGTAYETLAQRPAQARSSAVAFAGFIAEARSVAAVTGDETLDSGSGATIGVVRDGDDSVATIYTYRPILGAAHRPQRDLTIAPLRMATALGLQTATGLANPPFALFFSASGHASAQAGYRVGTSAALAFEPACPLETGIVVDFTDSAQTQSHAISCEMAQLDLHSTGATFAQRR